MDLDDETLMAFADGALPDAAFARVASAVEADPEVAARLNALVLGKDAARAVYGPLLDRPVPARLRRAVEAAIASAEPAPRRSPRWVGWAVAAALGGIVAGPAGYLLSRGDAPAMMVAGSIAEPGLRSLIETVRSGGVAALTTDTDFVAVASFRDGAGALCREIELLGPQSSLLVACSDDDAWTIRMAVVIATTESGDYVPAGELEVVGTYLDSIGAGPPLSDDAERAALPGIAE
ncbi:MAG: hypothetical protein KIS96_03100 [Bauldia sp.]|nr:hypothetical protein [Bauldia sp.]